MLGSRSVPHEIGAPGRVGAHLDRAAHRRRIVTSTVADGDLGGQTGNGRVQYVDVISLARVQGVLATLLCQAERRSIERRTRRGMLFAPALPGRDRTAKVSPVASAKPYIGWQPNPPS